MRPLNLEKSAWELKNERNKINVRWLFIVLITGYLVYAVRTEGSLPGSAPSLAPFRNLVFIGGLALGAAFINILLTARLLFLARRERALSPAFKYCTMSLDFLIVSLILLPAGGSRSMLFLVYFVVIISNGLRYGMRLSIFGVLIFNIAYVGVLLLEHYPEFRLKDFQNEILKVCGFWAVGLYVGYLSRRFDQLRGQTEKYQALLREALDEKKREARP